MKRLTAVYSLNWQRTAGILTAVVLGLLVAKLPLPLVGGLIGSTALVLLILIRPLFGLFVALLAAPLGALENIVLGPSLLDSGQLFLLVTLAVWLGRGLAYRQIYIPRTFLNLPLALFVFVTAVSLLKAPSLVFGFKELLKWLEIGAIMLMVVDLSVNRQPLMVSRKSTTDYRRPITGYESRNTYSILFMLLLAGLSQALVGIWQFGLRGDGPEHFLVLGRFYRAYGTFEQPNPFGGYMNLTALLALGVVCGGVACVWQRGRSQGSLFSLAALRTLPASFLLGWLFTGFMTVAAALAVVFSWSRGAWLSFAVGTAVMGLFWPKRRWQGIVLLGIGGVLFLIGLQIGVVPASVSERITSFSEDLRFGDVRGVDINDANYAVLERLAHWQAALDMAQDNVWLGVGFGNYEPAYADYALINWPYPLGHAHNYYLNVLAEIGVLGLVAYIGLWAAVFWQTMRQLRDLPWPLRGVSLGLLAAWTAMSTHHLVDKLYVNNIYIHLGVMFGLLQVLEYERQQNNLNGVLKQ